MMRNYSVTVGIIAGIINVLVLMNYTELFYFCKTRNTSVVEISIILPFFFFTESLLQKFNHVPHVSENVAEMFVLPFKCRTF